MGHIKAGGRVNLDQQLYFDNPWSRRKKLKQKDETHNQTPGRSILNGVLEEEERDQEMKKIWVSRKIQRNPSTVVIHMCRQFFW